MDSMDAGLDAAAAGPAEPLPEPAGGDTAGAVAVWAREAFSRFAGNRSRHEERRVRQHEQQPDPGVPLWVEQERGVGETESLSWRAIVQGADF